jgi:Uma2 family endonuclease
VKNEYLDGRILAKPAANRWHNLISTNFVIAIGSRIHRSTCEMYASDMQVRIGKNSICFPDIVVVNGEPAFADDRAELLLNPAVVIEIFSSLYKSTDRMQKLEGFLAIPKIKECLLVNENEMRIEHYARQNAKQWIYRIYNERDDVISLESINCKLSLAEVYTQVKLKEGELSSKAVN